MVEQSLKCFAVLSKSYVQIQFHKLNIFCYTQNFPGIFFFGKPFLFFYYSYHLKISLLQTKKGVLKSTPPRYLGTSNTCIALTINNFGG